MAPSILYGPSKLKLRMTGFFYFNTNYLILFPMSVSKINMSTNDICTIYHIYKR